MTKKEKNVIEMKEKEESKENVETPKNEVPNQPVNNIYYIPFYILGSFVLQDNGTDKNAVNGFLGGFPFREDVKQAFYNFAKEINDIFFKEGEKYGALLGSIVPTVMIPIQEEQHAKIVEEFLNQLSKNLDQNVQNNK